MTEDVVWGLARRLGRRSLYHDIHGYDRCKIIYSIFNILLENPSTYLIMQDDVTWDSTLIYLPTV